MVNPELQKNISNLESFLLDRLNQKFPQKTFIQTYNKKLSSEFNTKTEYEKAPNSSLSDYEPERFVFLKWIEKLFK